MTAFKALISRTMLSMLGFSCIASHAYAQAPATSGFGNTNACTAAAPALAPGGTLRASINVGNPVLAAIDVQTGKPTGVSVDLAAELAGRLHAKLQLVVATAAAASLDNVLSGRADIGFFAIDPRRGEEVRFTLPYVLIEGAYAVRSNSPIAGNEDVDRPGVSVAVSKGSAYDLYLSRTLQHANIVRISPTSAVFDAFEKQHLDVLAGVKPQLLQYASHENQLRVLDGRFMVIRQAMGVPKSRGDEAAQCVAEFVDAMRGSGFVAGSLQRHHIDGASVAKAGD